MYRRISLLSRGEPSMIVRGQEGCRSQLQEMHKCWIVNLRDPSPLRCKFELGDDPNKEVVEKHHRTISSPGLFDQLVSPHSNDFSAGETILERTRKQNWQARLLHLGDLLLAAAIEQCEEHEGSQERECGAEPHLRLCVTSS